ncbi:MAG: ABC transporter permease [Candidatus Aminicenantes bacterium]|nr:MAG: ABC transporter permease [Candidatus Aminicenantes bacterium]
MEQNKDAPPKLGEKLLKFFLPKGESESVAGDYEELYTEISQTRGKSRAYVWYWGQIIKSIWTGITVYVWWSFTMLKSYLKVALRNLKRHKIYALINISGLAIGMACCVLILLWINDEIRYDRFHKQNKNLYRVLNDLNYGPYAQLTDGTAYPLGPAIKEEIPEVEEIVRLLPTRKILVAYGEKRFYEENFIFADPSLFTIFTFPFIQGDPQTALSSPSSIVITQDMALKYFGSKDPIGKTLQTQNQNDYIVTGVLDSIPKNSRLQFGFVGSIERAVAMGARTHWSGWLYDTYVLLQPNTSFEEVNAKLEAWIETKGIEESRYYLQPLVDAHMYGLQGEGAIRPLSLFSTLALLILMIACINYMNLATARGGTRAKEIGLRKVVGAKKNNILRQFLSESVLFALFALLVSIILVALFLPVFNQISGKELGMNLVQNKFLFLAILGIILLTGILAGSYPAFFLSSFQPDRILKGTLTTKKIGMSTASIRKGLVVCQFILTIVLLISTTTVYRQMSFIKNRGLGFEKNHLIYTQLRSEGNLWERYDAKKTWTKYDTLKNELSQNPNVLDVSSATCLPFGSMGKEFGQLDWDGKDPEYQVTMNHMAVDPNFIKTFQLKMIEGRFLSEEFPSDSQNFVLNDAAIKATGLESPVGKRFRLLDKTGIIAGVIKDFHFAPLHEEIEPLVFHMMPYQYWMYRNYVFVRISADNISRTIASIENMWDKAIPEYPFEFHFLDDTIDARYRKEQRLETILRIFTFLAISISCFGLFGLIAFTAEQRTKEIGIRKVLGASVGNVVRLLSKEFIILVILANIIAWPVAYFWMAKWLKNFAYRTEIGLGTFLFSGFAALVIAILTVCFQSIKAALANPVDSLRYE